MTNAVSSIRTSLASVDGIARFLIWPLLRRHRPGFSIRVGSHEGKYCLRNLVPHLIGPASPPGLHSDRHRCSAHFHNVGVKADFIPDENRLMKNHSVHGNSRATATASAACGVCRGEVHLRHQPAAENVSGRIGIRGHGNRADQRFACRWVT
jgi:hypothetical protein